MKKKISAKILVLAGILFAAGIASVLLGFLFIHSMNKKSQKISNECMEAVTLMADTSTSIEKVQKYANSSAAFRMQKQDGKKITLTVHQTVHRTHQMLCRRQKICSRKMHSLRADSQKTCR